MQNQARGRSEDRANQSVCLEGSFAANPHEVQEPMIISSRSKHAEACRPARDRSREEMESEAAQSY